MEATILKPGLQANGDGVGEGHLIIADQLRLPRSISTLAAFREWAYEEYPEHGLVSYLGGDIWVDLSMEKLFTHNQVKAAISFAIMSILQHHAIGRFVPDRMLWSNIAANLSTEPDGLFFTWQTYESGRIRPVERHETDYLELVGTPDMVLEVVSDTSVRKDTIRLRELYWHAGVPEYWIVDARGESPQFEILQHTSTGYVAAEAHEGWVESNVFGCSLRLIKKTDPIAQPQFAMETQSLVIE